MVHPTKGLISARKQPVGPPLEQGAPPNASRNTPFIGNIIEPCNVAVLELLNALVGPLVPICERKQSLPAIEAAANLNRRLRQSPQNAAEKSWGGNSYDKSKATGRQYKF